MFCTCLGCYNRKAKVSDTEAVNNSSNDIDIDTMENFVESETTEEDDMDMNYSVDESDGFDESSLSNYDSSNEDNFCAILGETEC